MQNNKGTTLIELLVGITLFSIVVIAFFQLFNSVFKEQSKNLNKSYLLNNASYAMEYMSRALRMARKELDDPSTCLSVVKSNYEITRGGNGIKFINFDSHNVKECKEFFLENKTLKILKDGVDHPLTSSNVSVEKLKFDLKGEGSGDSQPKLTFALEVKIANETLKLQTTVSQRDLDVN